MQGGGTENFSCKDAKVAKKNSPQKWKSATLHRVIWSGLILSVIVWGGRKAFSEIASRGAPPVTPSAREEFLAKSLRGYEGVKFVNKYAGRTDTVCIIGGSWLNYYFQPQVLDLVGPMYAGNRPTFRWPDDQAWMQWLESKNVTWIFIDYASPQGFNIPNRSDTGSSFWPGFQPVYEDSEAWVFRRE